MKLEIFERYASSSLSEVCKRKKVDFKALQSAEENLNSLIRDRFYCPKAPGNHGWKASLGLPEVPEYWSTYWPVLNTSLNPEHPHRLLKLGIQIAKHPRLGIVLENAICIQHMPVQAANSFSAEHRGIYKCDKPHMEKLCSVCFWSRINKKVTGFA